jgi:hypothetical protein
MLTAGVKMKDNIRNPPASFASPAPLPGGFMTALKLFLNLENAGIAF